MNTSELWPLQLQENLKVLAIGFQTWEPKVCYLNTCWSYIHEGNATRWETLYNIWLNFKIYMCRSNFKYLCKFFLFPDVCKHYFVQLCLYIYFSIPLFSLPFIRASSAVAFLAFAILIVILRGFFFFFFDSVCCRLNICPPGNRDLSHQGATCELLPQFSGPSIVNPCRRTSVTISSLSEQQSS